MKNNYGVKYGGNAVMERFRVAITTNSGLTKGKNFDTKPKADEWVLLQMEEKIGVKYFRILDRKTGKIIETEKGKRDKK